ncbi:MAG: leucine-rich repeat domain-containing protein [Bacteroidales bacterium]|nr:leucine-rich repeat domain-containing protein [Bacteroidales bacterium]
MKTKFFTLFTALTLSAGTLFASDTAVGGIYYDFDATNFTATVTYRGSYSSEYDEYTGDVVIPATVNYDGKTYSVTSIGNGAFEYCSGLTSVTIPNSVTSIGEFAFSGCSSLIKTNYTGDIAGWCGINFGNYSANPTVYSYNLYINDVEVKDLMIPNSVTSIGNYAFSGCSGLTKITIPNSVTSIGEYAFSGCSGLTSITIPNSVTSIGEYAFKYCSSLTSVTIPNSVTSIGRSAFYGCSGLTSVTIPNSVTSIGSYAFYDCSGLTSVTIPNSVTSIGMYAFEGCSGLTSVLWNAKNFADFSSRDYAPFYNIKSQITSFTFGSEVEHIPAYLCYGMENLTSVTIPNNVTSIGDYAFRGCSGLTSVTIGNSVTSIGDWAFRACSGLTSVTIPNSVTSIGMYAFEGCSGLTSVVWNAKNFADFSSRDYAPFYNINSQITSFTFGSEVEHIPAYLCYGMENLTSVTIPNNVTSIGDYAFRGCSGLTSVTIPNSVTSIGKYAFYGCSGLTSVTIGNSVTSIGKSAFGECTQLINIVCYAAEPPSCDASSVFANYDASLKVPCNSLEAYKAAAVWRLFNNISYIESTVGLDQIELAGLYTQAGRIVCNGEFRIYDLIGRDVTRLNGSLQGVYVVKTANAAVKVVVR